MSEIFEYDICTIGGCGHVGLPLSIMFASKGKKVCIYYKRRMDKPCFKRRYAV